MRGLSLNGKSHRRFTGGESGKDEPCADDHPDAASRAAGFIVLATAGFLTIAAALGVGNGAVFGLLGSWVPAAQVGSVTGLVGRRRARRLRASPLVMGLVFQATGSFAIGLMLLSDVAFAARSTGAWRLLAVERLT